MARSPRWTTSLSVICLSAIASTALGQGSPELAAMQAGLSAASMGRDLGTPSQPALPTSGQYFQQPAAAGVPGRATPPSKPFQYTPQRPTISPYLNLYREEQDDTLPNYFAFVLPQLRAQEFAHQQQLELARIQQQLQQAQNAQSRGRSLPADSTGGERTVQPHNFHARFMNTGHYYGGVPLPQLGESEQ